MTPKQIEVGAATAENICLEYVDAYVPAMFKGMAESSIKEHPELFRNIAVHVYSEMEKVK